MTKTQMNNITKHEFSIRSIIEGQDGLTLSMDLIFEKTNNDGVGFNLFIHIYDRDTTELILQQAVSFDTELKNHVMSDDEKTNYVTEVMKFQNYIIKQLDLNLEINSTDKEWIFDRLSNFISKYLIVDKDELLDTIVNKVIGC